MGDIHEFRPNIAPADIKIRTDRGGVDCMTNDCNVIVMEHIPTGTAVYMEYNDKSLGAFYRGYLLAKLERVLSMEQVISR